MIAYVRSVADTSEDMFGSVGHLSHTGIEYDVSF